MKSCRAINKAMLFGAYGVIGCAKALLGWKGSTRVCEIANVL